MTQISKIYPFLLCIYQAHIYGTQKYKLNNVVSCDLFKLKIQIILKK